MSGINGDKARYNRLRKHKLLMRARKQERAAAKTKASPQR